MRPGRLDRILYVDAPDQAARHEIFRIRLANMAVEPDVSIEPLANVVCPPSSLRVLTDKQTEGCSGAEIISICQDAALTTMNEDPNAPFVSNRRDVD